MREDVVIPSRFNGPPASANGGYACGLVAEAIGPRARVSLRIPPPLDTPLTRVRDNGTARVLRDEKVVAEGSEAAPDVAEQRRVSVDEARAAEARFAGLTDHIFPTCFVCGPAHENGLRIFPGEVEGDGLLACTWTPAADLAQDDGTVMPIYVWSALDCPSGFACIPPGTMTVLASLTASLEKPLRAGETYVVTGWLLGRDGRKHRAASAIHDAEGTRHAIAEALWITMRQD